METNHVATNHFTTLSDIENRTRAAGKVLIHTGGLASGTVFQSKHDRVSEIHASGGMSTSTSVSVYQGTGSMHSSSSFSFEIHSEINTRHEFWIKSDKPDVQFVFFTHIPVADGHEVSLLPICYEGGGKSFVLGFLFQNHSANRTYFYAVHGKQANSLVDNVSVDSIVNLVEDRFLEDAFGTLQECAKADPEAREALLKVYKKFQQGPGRTIYSLTLLAIIIPAIFAWFAAGGLHFLERFLISAAAAVAGAWIVNLIGRATGAKKNANRSAADYESGKKAVGMMPLRRAVEQVLEVS